MQLPAFKIARFIGIVLLACAIVLLFVNTKAENNLPDGFYTPIIALEFIQSPKEVHHFFEVKDVAKYEQDLLLGNKIDYLFMLLYSSLLFCITIGIKKITQSNLLYLAMILSITMLLGDALENYQILQIIQKYKTGDITDNLSLLNIFTWLKWSSIASSFLLFSPFFFRGQLFHKITGILCVVCFALCIAAFLQHGILNELFATSVVLIFLLQIIFVFTFKTKSLKLQH